jgi:hypothetical protein
MLRDADSHRSFDRVRATAAELITRHDRVVSGNELHDELSEIFRLAREKGAVFSLTKYLQQEAARVATLGELIEKETPSAEAGKSNSEKADEERDPWLERLRGAKTKNPSWSAYGLAAWGLKFRPDTLPERSLSQLRRYAAKVCEEWSSATRSKHSTTARKRPPQLP